MNHSYRDEELQLWTSSGQMMQADEEPQLIPRFCILNQRGRASLWKNTDRRSSLITQSPSLSLHPRHSCLLQEAIQHSAFTSLDSLVINFSQEVTGTRLNSNVRDIFRLMTTDQCKSLIIFCDEDIPPHLSSNICYDKDSGVFMGNPGCNINDNNNVSSDLTNLTVHTLCEPNNNDSKDSQSEMVIRDCFHDGKCKCVLKSCQKCNNLGVSSGRDRNVKMSRSVSFDEEVIVYMFDQVLITWASTMVLGCCFLIILIQTKAVSIYDPSIDVIFRTAPSRSCTLRPAHLIQAAIPVICQTTHWKTLVMCLRSTFACFIPLDRK